MKREVKAEVVEAGAGAETDAQMAARLQREFDTLSDGRPSRRSGGSKPKRKKVVKRRAADTEDDDDEGKPKKKRAANGAFNKELILRYVGRLHLGLCELELRSHADDGDLGLAQ